MRIEYVSKLMGHASIKQTEVYMKIINEELDKAMEVFNKPIKGGLCDPAGNYLCVISCLNAFF
jgi:hypothetical protein